MRERKEHPRRILIHRPEREEAMAPSGIDFQRHTASRRAGRSLHILVILAVVVVLGALLASSVIRLSEPVERAAGPAAAVEGPFGPRQPAGEADPRGLVFTWSPHPAARGYELILEEAGGRVVWAVRLGPQTRITLPGELEASLASGRVFRWRVEAQLPDGGREVSRSLAFVAR
jgi:hypothetical protein